MAKLFLSEHKFKKVSVPTANDSVAFVSVQLEEPSHDLNPSNRVGMRQERWWTSQQLDSYNKTMVYITIDGVAMSMSVVELFNLITCLNTVATVVTNDVF